MMPFDIKLPGKGFNSIRSLILENPSHSQINITARTVEQQAKCWRNEHEYISLKLTDYSGSITSCVWPDKYIGGDLENLGCYAISGVYKKLDYGCLIEITDAERVNDPNGD